MTLHWSNRDTQTCSHHCEREAASERASALISYHTTAAPCKSSSYLLLEKRAVDKVLKLWKVRKDSVAVDIHEKISLFFSGIWDELVIAEILDCPDIFAYLKESLNQNINVSKR